MVGRRSAQMHRSAVLCFMTMLALAGCREQREAQRETPRQEPAPSTNAPANVSHGEAAIGSADQPPPIDPVAPPRSTSRRHRLRIEISHKKLTIAEGVTYDAWTFDGRVPGPVLRVTEGDTVDFTLVNS